MTYKQPKRHKYGVKRTERGGIVFDSLKEANRFSELKLLERGGVIKDLELQPRYDVVINGHKICWYQADFRYFDLEKGVQVVEDVKGMKTPVYRLKKKLVEALYPITITEV